MIPTVVTDYHSAVCAPQCLHGCLRACAVVIRSKSGAMTGHYDVRHFGGSECSHLFSFVSISFVCSRPLYFSNHFLEKRRSPTIVSFLSFLSSGYRRLTISTLRDDRYKYTELISDSCTPSIRD